MPGLDSTLTRPKLDATIVIGPNADGKDDHPPTPSNCPLFSLVSLNAKTAPSFEVRLDQLLALSLAPEGEPVITVGRHQDCRVCLPDPRVSSWHFEILARRLSEESSMENSVEACGSNVTRDSLAYKCDLKDGSSNGTSVNGTIVGRGNSTHLRTGDEICVLPASRVGADEMIGFVFRNVTESFAAPEEVRGLELDELVTCPICMEAIYKCVALTPCSHNFCMACVSEWMAKKKDDCPVCRRPIGAIMKNHPMDAVIEAFLDANPKWRRSTDELSDMDAKDTLKLGESGKWVRAHGTVGASSQTETTASSTETTEEPTGSERRRPDRWQQRASGSGSVRTAPPPPPGSRGSQVCSLQ